ncbi:winged helix-turn-helix transcriptional regulator [Fructobacillus sp. M2-14]|uniref:Winged helix-turn-helix transcriptional regulator n=1 Tax=Fructobacillus broussonetiae TaxID=2713173 RepID=A0ABS5QYB4_9LACO|nr:MarR family winged helix-turn-helix transcriptional regulator [Fructobacillus broussonetiae]MBS9338193.1 winged helix-turn-helix transcriptional regulator [Fructobacillus broussonetiae]
MSKANELNYLMRNIQINEQRLYSESTKEYPLSTSQARTLGYIENNPGVNQKDLSDHFNIRGASTSVIIKKLVEGGYVKKEASRGSQDRSNKLYITDEGLTLSHELRGLLSNIEDTILDGLTEEEIDALIRLLTKINQKFVE